MVRVRPEIESAPLDDRLVLFHPGRDEYVVLGDTERAVWESLGRGEQREAAVAGLAERTGLPAAEAAEVLDATVGAFAEHELVTGPVPPARRAHPALRAMASAGFLSAFGAAAFLASTGRALAISFSGYALPA